MSKQNGFWFYLDLFAALNRRVGHVLIGGLAIALHGIEWATTQIDVTVAMTPDNLSALVDMARKLGMTPMLPVPREALSDLDQLAQIPFPRLASRPMNLY